MTCKNCIHSRELVNKIKRNRVGCVIATDSDWIDERVREYVNEVDQEYIYPDKESTVRMVGITMTEDSECPYFNTGGG